MFWKQSIAARVDKVIAKRVDDAQKDHDTKCKELDEMLAVKKRVAEEVCEEAKESHAETMVNRVLGH